MAWSLNIRRIPRPFHSRQRFAPLACPTVVRMVRWAWFSALVLLSVFAVWLTFAFAPIRAYRIGRASWGMEPFEVSRWGGGAALFLFVLGHAVSPVLGPRRFLPRFVLELGDARHYRVPAEQRHVLTNAGELARAGEARRAVVCAGAIASALGIAAMGFLILRFSFHGPYQDPLEFLAYFYAATFALVTHAPRLVRVGPVSSGSQRSR